MAYHYEEIETDEDESYYLGTNNVYDDFESLELINPTFELGPHHEKICKELQTHEPDWLHELEKKFLIGNEKRSEYEEKMNMQNIIAHDQLHVQHKNIACSVYDDYEPANIDWVITAIELWAVSHFKIDYVFDEEEDIGKMVITKESPILKYRIVEWPHFLNPRHLTRTVPSLQDLCRETIQNTLGTSQEFQLYKNSSSKTYKGFQKPSHIPKNNTMGRRQRQRLRHRRR